MTGERDGSEVIELFVREVRLLRETMGGTIDVEIDDGEDLLLRAWRDELPSKQGVSGV